MAEHKTKVTQDMRRIYREHTGRMSDDDSILIWWNQQVKKAESA